MAEKRNLSQLIKNGAKNIKETFDYYPTLYVGLVLIAAEFTLIGSGIRDLGPVKQAVLAALARHNTDPQSAESRPLPSPTVQAEINPTATTIARATASITEPVVTIATLNPNPEKITTPPEIPKFFTTVEKSNNAEAISPTDILGLTQPDLNKQEYKTIVLKRPTRDGARNATDAINLIGVITQEIDGNYFFAPVPPNTPTTSFTVVNHGKGKPGIIALNDSPDIKGDSSVILIWEKLKTLDSDHLVALWAAEAIKLTKERRLTFPMTDGIASDKGLVGLTSE